MKEPSGIIYIGIFVTAMVVAVLSTNKIEKKHHDPVWIWELNK